MEETQKEMYQTFDFLKHPSISMSEELKFGLNFQKGYSLKYQDVGAWLSL